MLFRRMVLAHGFRVLRVLQNSVRLYIAQTRVPKRQTTESRVQKTICATLPKFSRKPLMITGLPQLPAPAEDCLGLNSSLGCSLDKGSFPTAQRSTKS